MPAQTRREFLRASGLVVAGATLARPTPAGAAATGGSVVRIAMHVHASFSEGIGSFHAQLAQAAAVGADVVWFSEHDWRMAAYGYRDAIHFDGLTENENGVPLHLDGETFGTLAHQASAIVTSPVSPKDPSSAGALLLAARSAGASAAGVRRRVNSMPGRLNTRANLAGQTIDVDVYPQVVGAAAHVDIELALSQRPASAGRPAGCYQLVYRVGGPDRPGTRRLAGDGVDALTGIVVVDAPVGSWTTVHLDPVADGAALWPDLDPVDAGLVGLAFSATSVGGAHCSGVVDYVRWTRSATTGDAPLSTQAGILHRLSGRYPAVTALTGLEWSLPLDHVNQYGGTLHLPGWSGPIVPIARDPVLLRSYVDAIHRAGGIASFNHMFGATSPPPLSAADQDALVSEVAGRLLTRRLFGVDILEVGYRLRGGVDVSRHLEVWDIVGRAGAFVTGTGVSDDHDGVDWAATPNRFLTGVWAAGRAEDDLVGALRAGRAWFADPLGFAGTLDLLVDSVCPMGSVSVSHLRTRNVAILATGLPSKGTVRVVRGVIDRSGARTPNTSVTSIPAVAWTAGSVTVPVDTSTACFVRVEVLDGSGTLIAGSNPVYLLRARPPGGIPPARHV